MSRLTRLLMVTSGLVLLAGCSNVQTTVTSFHNLNQGIGGNGSISVMAGDKKLHGTLEFSHHRALLEQRLMEQGYQVTAPGNDSDYVAFLSYGIDGGRTELSSRPVMGTTVGVGFGAVDVDDDGNVFYGSYLMPTFGVVGSTTDSQTLYTSAIAIDIVERDSLEGSDPKRLYEGRARSSGRCSAITPIFDEMLSALFEDFPGVSGQTQTKSVRSSGDSC